MKQPRSIGEEIHLARQRRGIKRELRIARVPIPTAIAFDLAALQKLYDEQPSCEDCGKLLPTAEAHMKRCNGCYFKSAGGELS